MKYPRYAYKDPSVKIKQVIMPYSNVEVSVPAFEYPITPHENFKRAMAGDNPYWAPDSFSDVQTLGAQDVVTKKVRGMQIHTDFREKATGDYEFKDWFNTDWTWVQSAGGAMLTPGTQLLGDITDWETELVWPELAEWDFDETAARFMKEEYDPDKALSIDIGRGCTERLVSLLGGYTEGMLALAVEPEAVKAFFESYSDFVIKLFDKIQSLYPVDMVVYHDDWGTERDTFFSEKMMEELVFEPTKKVIDHIKSKGVVFMLHTCGNVTRFAPHMEKMGADILQIQRRAVDIPELKRRYKMGINAGIEDWDFVTPITNERLAELVRKTVDIYAPGGGYLAQLYMSDPEQLWVVLTELYAYSRELYDTEQGRE